MALKLSSRRVQLHQTVRCQTIFKGANIPCSWDAHYRAISVRSLKAGAGTLGKVAVIVDRDLLETCLLST
jgi:hypothetical protein